MGRDDGDCASGGVGNRCRVDAASDAASEALAVAAIVLTVTAVAVRATPVMAAAAMTMRWWRWPGAYGWAGCGRACGGA